MAINHEKCPNCGHDVLTWEFVCPGCNQIPWKTEAAQRVIRSNQRKIWLQENVPVLGLVAVVGGFLIWSIVSAQRIGLLKTPAGHAPTGAVPSISKTFDEEEYRGKFVLINFWASWCGPCHEETPVLRNLYREVGGHDQVRFVGISLDRSREAMIDYLQRYNVEWPQVFDGKGDLSPLKRQYGVEGIPHTIMLDPSGNVLWDNSIVVPFIIRSLLEQRLGTHFERFALHGQADVTGRLSYDGRPLTAAPNKIEIELFSRDTNERSSPQYTLEPAAVVLHKIPFGVYRAFLTLDASGVEYAWQGNIDITGETLSPVLEIELLRKPRLLQPTGDELSTRPARLSSPVHFVWEPVAEATQYSVSIFREGSVPVVGGVVKTPEWSGALRETSPGEYYFIRIEVYRGQRMIGLRIIHFTVGQPDNIPAISDPHIGDLRYRRGLKQLLALTINGVAAGMRHTG